ncbi:hypothetical protein HK100_007700, partial [Physocladia obscura]
MKTIPFGLTVLSISALCTLPIAGFSGNSHDPCAEIVVLAAVTSAQTNSSAAVFPASSARECFESFPVSAHQRHAHIAAISRFAALYPFIDLVAPPPSSDNQQDTDTTTPQPQLLAALDAIAHNDFITSEFVFHGTIYDILNGLNDAHVNYDAACFTGKIAVVQPFLLQALPDDDAALVILGSIATADGLNPELGRGLDLFWSNAFDGYYPSDFVGYKVLKIDGVEAVNWMKNYAQSYIGKTKFKEARFNYALPSYQWLNHKLVTKNGSFAVQDRIHSGIKDSVTYTIDIVSKKGVHSATDFIVPWAAFVGGGSLNETKTMFESASIFYEKNCVKKISSLEMKQIEEEEEFLEATSVKPVFPAYLPSVVEDGAHGRQYANKWELGKVSEIYSGKHHAFFGLEDGETGVWVISTFSPSNETESFNFAKDMMVGLTTLESLGSKKLIIDVTNNGGGTICLGCVAAYVVAPWESRTCYRYDIRVPKVLETIFTLSADQSQKNTSFDAGIFNISNFGRTTETTAMTSLSELLDPGRTSTRNGVANTYSNLFTLDHSCQETFAVALNASLFPQLQNGWKADNVAVVSNGFCGSTCANFCRTLRDKHGIRSYTYGGGGAAKTPFQPSAFEGGMVLGYQSFDTVVSKNVAGAPATDDLVFPLARARFPFYEVYPDYDRNGTGLPAEWIPQVAEGQLENVNATDPETVWNRAREALERGDGGL